MSALARSHNAVNLAQGFPDFPGPQKLLDLVSQEVQSCHNQYSLSSGEERLRMALANFVDYMIGVKYDPQTEITVTTGATEAIYSVVNAFVNPGERVVVFEPYYDSYAQAIANAGGVLLPVRLHAPDTPKGKEVGDWAIDWDDFNAAVAGGFKLLILNTPHNPTGKVFSEEELKNIATGVKKAQALAMCDEVYENLVYDDTPFVSLANLLKDNVIRVSSAAKTFGFTGFKVGWVCAPAGLTKSVRLVHQGTVFCTNAHVQLGLAGFLEDKKGTIQYLKEANQEYSTKRNFLKSGLEIAGFEVGPCRGTYFLMANYRKLAPDLRDVEYAKKLIVEKKVAVIPPSVFYSKAPEMLTWLRFAFCKTDPYLKNALENLGVK